MLGPHRAMDHRYIDECSVTQRYLDHILSTPERLEFEAHLVDCQECTDRLLLAEMFLNHNGVHVRTPDPIPQRSRPHPKDRALMRFRFVLTLTRAQAVLWAGAAAVLVLVPVGLTVWATQR